MVVFHVPEGVGIALGRVAGDLHLFEAPLWQLLSAASQNALHKVVGELDSRSHRLDLVPLTAAQYLNPPNVVGVARTVLQTKQTNINMYTVELQLLGVRK